ncbi:hypothetical protein SPBRAN_759 [uncultured Candidatus Thioglobus sp.]|nr:hypothetical protein SPBRAN_759 [uncultured Candidatus Thioglobus sp.]
MFTTKKSETTTPSTDTTPKSTPRAVVDNSTDNTSQNSTAKTVISEGCLIKGEILGTSDIIIFGQVDGIISTKDNILTIEKSGNVKANIIAKIVNITGNVTGNINANEKIIIHDKGNVTGDMSAPKIILKDGSYFTGNVSMNNTEAKVDANKASKTQMNKLG